MFYSPIWSTVGTKPKSGQYLFEKPKLIIGGYLLIPVGDAVEFELGLEYLPELVASSLSTLTLVTEFGISYAAPLAKDKRVSKVT